VQKIVSGCLLVSALLLGTVGAANARESGALGSYLQWPGASERQASAAASIPELDPSGAASVVSLLLASALVLSHRRRSTQAA